MADGFELHIDDDWKAQARKEKEKLAERDRARAEAAAAKPSPSPAAATPGAAADTDDPTPEVEPASFRALVGTLASQAMLYLGLMPDPMTGRRIVGLDYARQQIDLLQVLQDKTTGNLDDDETDRLALTMHQLREQYVQTAIAMRPIP